MNKLLLSILLGYCMLLLPPQLFAQTTQRFTLQDERRSVTYPYYENSKGERIFHGPFLLKIQHPYEDYSLSIEGTFFHGKMHNTWKRIAKNGSRITTYSCVFSNGLRNGPFSYTEQHAGSAPYIQESGAFLQGMLRGKFQLKYENNYQGYGAFDDEGRADGDFCYQDEMTEYLYRFRKGLCYYRRHKNLTNGDIDLIKDMSEHLEIIDSESQHRIPVLYAQHFVDENAFFSTADKEQKATFQRMGIRSKESLSNINIWRLGALGESSNDSLWIVSKPMPEEFLVGMNEEVYQSTPIRNDGHLVIPKYAFTSLFENTEDLLSRRFHEPYLPPVLFSLTETADGQAIYREAEQPSRQIAQIMQEIKDAQYNFMQQAAKLDEDWPTSEFSQLNKLLNTLENLAQTSEKLLSRVVDLENRYVWLYAKRHAIQISREQLALYHNKQRDIRQLFTKGDSILQAVHKKIEEEEQRRIAAEKERQRLLAIERENKAVLRKRIQIVCISMHQQMQYIASHEITNQQFAFFLNHSLDPVQQPFLNQTSYPCQIQVKNQGGKTIYEVTPGSESLPVCGITLSAAKSFCTWIGASLPTQEQWTIAYQGSLRSFQENEPMPKNPFRFAGSGRLKDIAWTKENSQGKLQPVGKLAPTELQIFDLCGNVAEYVAEGMALGGSVVQEEKEDFKIDAQTPQEGSSPIGFRVMILDGASQWLVM